MSAMNSTMYQTLGQFQRFFQERQLVYLSRSRVEAVEVADFDWGTSRYYLENQAEFERLTLTYGSAIRQSLLAPVSLKMVSEEVGWGLFAAEDLHQDDFVGEYAGVIQPALECPPDERYQGHYLSDFAWNYPDELPDGREFEINALKEGNILRFVNHSYHPNIMVDHTLVDGLFVTFFRVLEPIARGQQLLIDYGEEYWSGGYRTLVEL